MTRVVLVMAFCVYSSICSEGADTTNPAAKSVLALEQEFGTAEVKRDLGRMASLLTDDCTDIEDDGTLHTKTDVLNLFRNPGTQLRSDEMSEIQIRVYTDTAIVTFVDTADFMVDGKQAGGRFRMTDVWVRRNGSWQLAALHSSRIR
jgi:ketosteroid isomerase-like protein